ncbi:MAG TPA: rhodanese-like domain-containing protein [Terriglobales bacterium]|nr:rhodanese-like domain-containing protein [Terriglobales bacterium]
MSTTTTDTKIQTISTQELQQKLQNKQNFEFWNVLTDEYFKGENISGSRRVPLDKVGNEVRQSSIAKNADIVVYCAGPHCPQSRMAAEKLVKLGYDNVRAYEGGLEEWKQAGYGIDKA